MTTFYNRVNINERLVVIDLKERLGEWQADTVTKPIKLGGGALMTKILVL